MILILAFYVPVDSVSDPEINPKARLICEVNIAPQNHSYITSHTAQEEGSASLLPSHTFF